MAEDRRLTLVMLLTVGCVSLMLISGVDDNCYRFLARTAPTWKIVPALRITSLLACGILCFAFGRHSMRAPLPTTPWRTEIAASGSWLCSSILALFVFHVWTPLLPSWIDVSSFLLTGLLGEELLFRGAVFSLGQRMFGPTGRLPLAAIGISAVSYGVQHLGYHGWHFSATALTQVAYTIAFGVLLGLLRAWSGTLWVPAAVHFANNLVTVIYRHLGN